MDVVPIDYFGNEFREPSYWNKYKDKVIKGKPLLHSQNAPHRDTIKDYFNWFVGPGREWLQNGNVIYVPNLPSEQVEQELFAEGMSLSNHYFDTNIFPANDARYIASSEIMCNLNLPALTGCTADWIAKFREDNSDKLQVFNNYLDNFLKHSRNFEQEGQNFGKNIKDISEKISDEIVELSENIKKQKNKLTSKGTDIAFDIIPIVVSAFTGLPPWAVAISSIPLARQMIKNMAETLKKNKEFKNSPLYVMTKFL